MKKLAVLMFALGLFTVNAAAFSITDPFYMPEKGQLMGDLSVGFTNRDARLYKSFGINGAIQLTVAERLAFGFGIGWAKIRHATNGMQDPTITMKYRFRDGLNDGYFLDLDAFFSPRVFDSPWRNQGGSAKGATDFGATFKAGSTEMINNFTVYAGVGAKYYGHNSMDRAGTGLTALAGAKYYIDERNSVDLSFNASNYFGFISDHIGAGFDINYSCEFEPNKAAYIIYFGAERHNKHINSYTHWGVKWRYLF